MQENYIYLGKINNDHCLVHYVGDEKRYKSLNFCLDAQIMNIMRVHSMIDNSRERCVVFTVGRENKITARIIRAIKRDDEESYLADILKQSLEPLLRGGSRKFIIFKYEYASGKFGKLPALSDLAKTFRDGVVKQPVIEKVEYYAAVGLIKN